MTCPSAQVLSRYYDELVVGEEQRQIMLHVTSCEACQHVLVLYDGETQFIKETLRNPSLPVNFVDEVLEQGKPRKEWRLLTSSYVIALGIIVLFIITLLSADVVM